MVVGTIWWFEHRFIVAESPFHALSRLYVFFTVSNAGSIPNKQSDRSALRLLTGMPDNSMYLLWRDEAQAWPGEGLIYIRWWWLRQKLLLFTRKLVRNNMQRLSRLWRQLHREWIRRYGTFCQGTQSNRITQSAPFFAGRYSTKSLHFHLLSLCPSSQRTFWGKVFAFSCGFH